MCATKEQILLNEETLTFRKSVSKSNFVKCILVGIRIVPVQHILHNHSRLYILECKHHPLSVHSLDYMSMCSVRCSFLYHMVDCKSVHRIFSIYLAYNLACRHKYHLYNHHFHNLKISIEYFIFEFRYIYPTCMFCLIRKTPINNAVYQYHNLTDGTCWNTKTG